MIGSRLMRSHLVSFIFQMTVIVRLCLFCQNTQYSMQETANAAGKRDGVFVLNSSYDAISHLQGTHPEMLREQFVFPPKCMK